MAPTQTPRFQRGGCLHSFMRCHRGWVRLGGIGAELSADVYCAWLQRRGARVYRNTPVSLYWSSPDCMSDRLSGDPEALICVFLSIFVQWGKKNILLLNQLRL